MERLLKSRLKSGQFNVSPERSRIMAAVRGKGNKTTEVRLNMALVRAGVSGWTSQRADLPGKPDFFFANARLAVFVDGCFWHGCSRIVHPTKSMRDKGLQLLLQAIFHTDSVHADHVQSAATEAHTTSSVVLSLPWQTVPTLVLPQ